MRSIHLRQWSSGKLEEKLAELEALGDEYRVGATDDACVEGLDLEHTGDDSDEAGGSSNALNTVSDEKRDIFALTIFALVEHERRFFIGFMDGRVGQRSSLLVIFESDLSHRNLAMYSYRWPGSSVDGWGYARKPPAAISDLAARVPSSPLYYFASNITYGIGRLKAKLTLYGRINSSSVGMEKLLLWNCHNPDNFR